MNEIHHISFILGMLTAIYCSLMENITNFIYIKAEENKRKDIIIYKMYWNEALSEKEMDYRYKIILKLNRKVQKECEKRRRKRKNNTI